jgi:uncharacterized protein YqeY
MLKDELKKELVVAMKAHETLQKEQIKGLLTGIQMKEIEMKRDLTEEEQVAIVKNDLKKLNEELAFSIKANREDKVEASNQKIAFIEKFLPKQWSKEQIMGFFNENATKEMNIGELNKMIRKDHASVVDGKLLNEVIKEFLAK